LICGAAVLAGNGGGGGQTGEVSGALQKKQSDILLVAAKGERGS